MADQPQIRQPYANIISPPTGIDTIPKVPAGPVAGKKSQAELAMQGLIGAR